MTTSTGSLLVLSGPPASGKTTIAEQIATRAERPTVHVPTDALHTWIKSGFVMPFLPEGAHQNAVVLEAMLAAASAYARGGYDVILDGVLGPWAVESLRNEAAAAGLRLSYAAIYPRLDVALRRAEEREGRHLRDPGPIIGLHQAFASAATNGLAVLDNSDQSTTESAHEIEALWRSGDLEI